MIILDYRQYDIYLQSKEGRSDFSEGCPKGRSRGTSREKVWIEYISLFFSYSFTGVTGKPILFKWFFIEHTYSLKIFSLIHKYLLTCWKNHTKPSSVTGQTLPSLSSVTGQTLPSLSSVTGQTLPVTLGREGMGFPSHLWKNNWKRMKYHQSKFGQVGLFLGMSLGLRPHDIPRKSPTCPPWIEGIYHSIPYNLLQKRLYRNWAPPPTRRMVPGQDCIRDILLMMRDPRGWGIFYSFLISPYTIPWFGRRNT